MERIVSEKTDRAQGPFKEAQFRLCRACYRNRGLLTEILVEDRLKPVKFN